LYALTMILHDPQALLHSSSVPKEGLFAISLCMCGRSLHTSAAKAIPSGCCSENLPGASTGRHNFEGSFVALCPRPSASLDLAEALLHLFSLIFCLRLQVCSSRA